MDNGEIMKNKLLITLLGLLCFEAKIIQAKGIPSPVLGERLIEAIKYEHNPQEAQRLIAGGADLNTRDNAGKTPLHLAVLSQDEATMQALIKAGANINAQDSSLNTPLHEAVLMDNVAAIKALIKAGAHKKAKNNANMTPLELAQQFNVPEVLQALGQNKQ